MLYLFNRFHIFRAAYPSWHHLYHSTFGVMTLRIAFSLLVCSLFFTSCDLWHHGGDDEPDEPVLLPLDVGNQWVMEFTRTFYSPLPDGGTETETYTDTLIAVTDTMVAGERWTEIQCTRSSICIPEGYYTNRDDGVWKWAGPEFDTAPYLIYKYPAETGESYLVGNSDPLTVTVVGTEVPVETPAGTLSAYYYEFSVDELLDIPVPDDVGSFDRFLAPGLGFAFIGCSFVRLRDGEWQTASEFDWQLVAFEGN